MHVIDLEQPLASLSSLAGRQPSLLRHPLEERGARILGTSLEDIDRAEAAHENGGQRFQRLVTVGV